jgi:hypothetical protein
MYKALWLYSCSQGDGLALARTVPLSLSLQTCRLHTRIIPRECMVEQQSVHDDEVIHRSKTTKKRVQTTKQQENLRSPALFYMHAWVYDLTD